jgi:hypothetical protein
MGFPVHLLRRSSHSNGFIRCAILRNDARLIHHHLVVLNDDGIRRTKVNGYFLCEKTEKSHAFRSKLSLRFGFNPKRNQEQPKVKGRQIILRLKDTFSTQE